MTESLTKMAEAIASHLRCVPIWWLRHKKRLLLEKDCYWVLERDGSKTGPYCTACLDERAKRIHLKGYSPSMKCPICGTYHNLDKSRLQAMVIQGPAGEL